MSSCGVADELLEPLLAAEERRCHALGMRDWDTLRGLLADDFVYHHWRGQTEEREQWLSHLESFVSYRTVRESLHVDVYGDYAVVVGLLRNVILRRGSSVASTSLVSAVQIWSWVDGRWIERAHHSFKSGAERIVAVTGRGER